MITNLKLNNLTNKVTIIDKKQLILENNFNKLLSEYKNKLLRIETNIIKLNNKIEDIDQKLICLINLIDKDVKQNCQKMSNHIDFIENIYEKIKAPMNYICSKFNTLMLVENN